MLFRIIAGVSLTLAFLLTGCATNRGMAVLDNPTAVSKPAKPVYLLTVTLRNPYKTAYQPKLVSVKVQKRISPENSKTLLFEADPLAKSESISPVIGNSYLLRLELEPGDYLILGLNSIGQSIFTNGVFFTPLEARLMPSTPGIYYLGHIEATVRERKPNEFRAGPIFPLQEQGLTGASSGTFEVEISDRWETDNAKFQTKFPALSGANVKKTVLPAFERAQIQQWWDKNAFNDVP